MMNTAADLLVEHSRHGNIDAIRDLSRGSTQVACAWPTEDLLYQIYQISNEPYHAFLHVQVQIHASLLEAARYGHTHLVKYFVGSCGAKASFSDRDGRSVFPQIDPPIFTRSAAARTRQ